MIENPPPELLTASQAARLVSVGERTFWRWTRSGVAPAPIRIGSGLKPSVRYRRRELEAWVAAGCPNVSRTGWAWETTSSEK